MWKKVEHGESRIFKINMADWLAGKLNEMGATHIHVLYHDQEKEIFEAIAYCPPKIDVDLPPQDRLSLTGSTNENGED